MQQPTGRVAGVLPVWKPAGKTSARYIYPLRPILGVQRIGHAGTLDPFAEGVLLACVGRPATRLAEGLMNLPKRYVATLRLGVTNACHDTEMPLEPVPGARPPTLEQVRAALPRFRGRIRQVPPVYSAVKVQGKPACRRMRTGAEVELADRPVSIYALELLDYAWPLARIEVLCGRGTYIRALVRDMGEVLGTGAVCVGLTRAAVGPFDETQCIRVDAATTRQQACERLIDVERVRQIVAEHTPHDCGAPRQTAEEGDGNGTGVERA